jgi:iron(III) transport system substrate-binding protein
VPTQVLLQRLVARVLIPRQMKETAMAERLTRRSFIRVASVTSPGFLIAACSAAAPAAPPTAAPAKPTAAPAAAAPPTAAPQAAPAQQAPAAPAAASGDAQWQSLLDAARKEGKVVVQTPAGAAYREAIDAFGKAYPGIEPEHLSFPDAATFVPKIRSDRAAGIYAIDVGATTITPFIQFFKPDGVIDPLLPLLRPEILDDKVWHGGVDGRWGDLGKTHVFRYQANIQRAIHLNTNLIKEDEIQSVDDLLDPKWKGKIATSEVTQGYVYTPSTLVREQKGEDFLRKLFQDQEPVMIRDRRQAVETLVRGGAAIGYGLHPVIMQDFVRDGLAGHIRNPAIPGATTSAGEITVIYNKAPHPNAAVVFIHWLLSREGQTVWSSAFGINSARTDVPVVDPDNAPGPVMPPDVSHESWLTKVAETQEFMKTLI